MTWMDDLVQFSRQKMPSRVLELLWSRGVTDAQIAMFQVGYIDQVLPGLGPDADEFLNWSMNGARLDDMLVFPLTNTTGQIRGLQFRHASRDKKGFIDYFLSKDEAVFFGLSQAMPHVWETNEVFLVEGVFDHFPVQRVFPNVIPTMTAGVPESLLRVLKRMAATLHSCFDADKAGQRAAYELRTEHRNDFDVRNVNFPRIVINTGSGDRYVKDPGELWETLGEERFGVLVKTWRNTNG